VSIKDPFTKNFNYGNAMLDKEKLKNLLEVLRSFMKAAAMSQSEERFL